jgi:hypothetical protein
MKVAPAILGAGSVRIDYYDPILLAYQGIGDPLGADKFEITPDSESKQKTAKTKEAYGQVVASVAFAKPTKIAITLSALSAQTLAMQMQGIRSDWTQGAATLTDEVLIAKLDKWIKLSKRNLSDTGLTVKHTSGTPTYVLGTDYQVNYFTGEIKPLSTGAIAADQSLKVSASALAIAGDQIRGGTQAQVRARVTWEGINMVDGQQIECECWEAVLTSSKGFDFLASDFNGTELTGYLVVPVGKTEPYVVRMK